MPNPVDQRLPLTLLPSNAPVQTFSLATPRKPPAPYKLPWANVYHEEFVELFCREIARGRVLLRICIEEAWAPSEGTVYNWLRKYVEFREAYDCACQIRAEDMANDILELADNSVDHEKTRQQIDARKWLAGKLSTRYGDKKVVETNVNASLNVNETVRELDVSHLSIPELKALESAFTKTLELQATAAEEDPGE